MSETDDRTLSILHIVHYFLPHHRHGTEQATFMLAAAQRDAGHRVAVFTSETGRFSRELSVGKEQYAGLDVYRAWFNPRSENAFLGHTGLAKEFQRVLDETAPDIIHVQHLSTLSLQLVTLAKVRGIPVVMTLHDYQLVCPRVQLIRGDHSLCTSSDRETDCVNCLANTVQEPMADRLGALPQVFSKNITSPRSWRLLFSRLSGMLYSSEPAVKTETVEDLRQRTAAVDETLNQIDRLIAPTADFARRFEKFAGLMQGWVDVVHHTVDASRFKRRVRETARTPLRLGYVGKIGHVKGLELLLEAIAVLPAGSVTLDVYGSPSWTNLEEVAYFHRMKRLAARLPVTLHERGFTPDKAGAVFDSFDLLVVPSIWYETAGLVILEAFAAGVPVVCPNEGGPSELVRDGIDGAHFTFRDKHSLADVLRGFSEEPQRLQALSENTQQPGPPADYLERMLAIYGEVLAEVSDGTTA